MTSPSGSDLELQGLDTEQVRAELADLDLLSVERLVSLMCRDVRRVPEAIVAAESSIARAVEGVVERLERGGRLIYVGAGTAGRLGMLDAAEAGPTFGVPPGQVVAVLAGGSAAFDVAAENAEDDRDGGREAIAVLGVSPDDAVIGIAASGRTPFVLAAVETAREAGAFTVGLACNAGSPLAAGAEAAIEVVVGAEILAGSTRLNAGTAQKVVLNIISTAAMVQLGRTYGGLMVDLRATNAKLRDRATRIVAEIAGSTPDEARAALERCEWRPKAAVAVLLGGIEPEEAVGVLTRHRGRLRATLEEIAPPAARSRSTRLGVGAAYVDGAFVSGDVGLSGDRIGEIGLAGHGTGLAIPLLVDAQVNGYSGIDVLTADEEGLDELGRSLLGHGVRAYLPTLISSSEEELVEALRRVARVAGRGKGGALVAGVHLEGPFLSPERAGTHPVEHLRLPDPGLLARLLDAGPVRMVTLAPELPGALELIRECVRRGVAVSLGHSQADADESRRAFAAGAGAVTHLFNAMAPLSARAPGLVGAALTTPGISVQLIADGVHVSDELLRVAFAAAPGRCSLVSDAISAASLRDGLFTLGTVTVEVDDGVARRQDGTLAGSTARLTEGLARLGRIGIAPADAVAAVTDRPAVLAGVAELGRLSPGQPADLLVLNDDLTVRRVIVGGREVAAAER